MWINRSLSNNSLWFWEILLSFSKNIFPRKARYIKRSGNYFRASRRGSEEWLVRWRTMKVLRSLSPQQRLPMGNFWIMVGAPGPRPPLRTKQHSSTKEASAEERALFVSMKVPELQNFLKARDMHFKSCGWKGKGKGGTTMKLCKNAAEMTLFRRTLFSIFNLATFLTSSSISCWSMSVWQEAETDFFTVFMFFSVGEELTLLSLHRKIHSRSFKATSDDTRTFRWKLQTAFTPWIYISSFRYHSSRSLGPLVGWISLETPRLPPFFILHKVFTMSLVSKCWEHMCRSRYTETPCQLAGKRCSISFEAFSYSEERKSWGLVAFWNCFCTRKWHNTSISSVLLSK